MKTYRMKAEKHRSLRKAAPGKVFGGLLPMLALLLCLVFAVLPAQAAPTDEILSFEITVDVNDDASLNMIYRIEWKVLYDGGGSDKLTWVDLGVPNRYHTDIRPLSSTIKRIEDKGSALAIYLDREYGKNEVVTFEFAMTQDHMYQIDKWVQGETVFTLTPAWFDDFSVDSLIIRWNADQAGAWQPDCLQENGYLVFKTQLSPGGQYTMSVVYPNDAFGFSADRQNDENGGKDPEYPVDWEPNDSTAGETIAEIIAGFLGLIIAAGLFIVGPIVLIVKFIRWITGGASFSAGASGGQTEKKITRTKIVYYDNCPSCGSAREEGKDNCPYCGRSMIKSKEVVEESQIEKPERYSQNGTYRYGSSPNTYIRVNVISIPSSRPRSGSGGSFRSGGGSHHSSCASSCACVSHCACVSSCACACACASSGRAGCSVKDFFRKDVHENRIQIDSKQKEIGR